MTPARRPSLRACALVVACAATLGGSATAAVTPGGPATPLSATTTGNGVLIRFTIAPPQPGGRSCGQLFDQVLDASVPRVTSDGVVVTLVAEDADGSVVVRVER